MKKNVDIVIGLAAMALIFFPLICHAAFSDSTIEQTSGPTCYVPGETAMLCFTVTNEGDNAITDRIWEARLTFPPGYSIQYISQDPTYFDESDNSTEITVSGNIITFWT